MPTLDAAKFMNQNPMQVGELVSDTTQKGECNGLRKNCRFLR